MLNRWRDVDRETTSSIVRTSETGRPLAWRSSAWIGELNELGFPRVRTTQEIGVSRTLSALRASGTCAFGTYIVGPGSRLRPPPRTSPTMPTICRGVSVDNSDIIPFPIQILSLSGSDLGQYCRAMA